MNSLSAEVNSCSFKAGLTSRMGVLRLPALAAEWGWAWARARGQSRSEPELNAAEAIVEVTSRDEEVRHVNAGPGRGVHTHPASPGGGCRYTGRVSPGGSLTNENGGGGGCEL